MIKGQPRRLAPPAGPLEKARLNQIGFIDIFERAPVFLHGRRQGVHPDRSPSELVDDRQKNLAIHLIKTGRIDTQPCKRILGHSLGDLSLRLDLGIVPHPLDQADSQCVAFLEHVGQFPPLRRSRSGFRATPLSVSRWSAVPPESRTPAGERAKSVPQRGGQGPGPGRGPDERKPREIQFHRSGRRPLPDHEIELIVFHRRIERLFDGGRESMNLIDEQDIVFLKIRQDGGQIARMAQDQTGGRAEGRSHLTSNNVGDGGLAKPWGAIKNSVIERFARCFAASIQISKAILSFAPGRHTPPRSADGARFRCFALRRSVGSSRFDLA